jgi:hypothetical protein
MMALLELCSAIDCSSIYVCVDRRMKQKEYHGLTKDLRWVGFEATTLADWTVYEEITSKHWTFLHMDVD